MASGKSAVLALSDLTPATKRVTTCARVSRMWDYYGKDGKLAHVDLVLIDAQGTKMYAEVGANHAKKFKTLVSEGEVYLLREFFLHPAKGQFRAVDGRYVMRVTPWTVVQPVADVPADYPRYAYSLTPFIALPSLIGAKESFIDALGILTAISGILEVHLPGKPAPSMKRTLHLVDIDGVPMEAALWGNKATDLDAEALYTTAQAEPVVILFVGCLMKSYRGRDTLSCGDAGKFYLNPEIPEKEEYYTRLGNQLPHVRWLRAEDDQYYNPAEKTEAEKIEIKYLLDTSPNEYLGKRMICDVTIMRLQSTNWWFMACSKCHKSAYTLDDKFKCSDPECPCPDAGPRYKVRLIGADATGEVEFVFFAAVAEQIIQKKAELLARAAARNGGAIPTEITSLVSQRYTLNVSVSQRGLEFGELAFQVNSVDVVYKKAKVFDFASLASGSGQSARSATKDDKVGGTAELPVLNAPALVYPAKSVDANLPTTLPPAGSIATTVQDGSPDGTLVVIPPTTTPPSVNKQSKVPVSCPGSTDPKNTHKRSADGTDRLSSKKKLFK